MADFFAPKPRAGRVAPEPGLGSIPENRDAPATLPRPKEDQFESTEHVAAAVDSALAAGDVAGARGLLSLEAGAGDAATWTVSAALHPWDEGKPLSAALPDLGGAPGGDVALGDARFDVVERPDDDAALLALLPPEAARL